MHMLFPVVTHAPPAEAAHGGTAAEGSNAEGPGFQEILALLTATPTPTTPVLLTDSEALDEGGEPAEISPDAVNPTAPETSDGAPGTPVPLDWSTVLARLAAPTTRPEAQANASTSITTATATPGEAANADTPGAVPVPTADGDEASAPSGAQATMPPVDVVGKVPAGGASVPAPPTAAQGVLDPTPPTAMQNLLASAAPPTLRPHPATTAHASKQPTAEAPVAPPSAGTIVAAAADVDTEASGAKAVPLPTVASKAQAPASVEAPSARVSVDGPGAELLAETPATAPKEAPVLATVLRAAPVEAPMPGVSNPQAAPVVGIEGTPRTEPVPQSAGTPDLPRETPPQSSALGDQAVRSVRLLTRQDGHQSVSVRLVPESLGELRLEVERSGDTLTVRMTSANPVVREALESQARQMQQALMRDGVETVRVEVNVASAGADTPQGRANADASPHRDAGGARSDQTPGGAAARSDAAPRERATRHAGQLNVFV